MTTTISCRGVRKRYGDLQALDGVSFDVHEGEIFGMIGPNGAGKTTLMECLEGLRSRDGGTVEVLGMDPERRSHELRTRIGVQLQSSALPSRVKVNEALRLFASFYPRPVDPRSLLDRLGLTDKGDAYVATLSGGQRQRVFIALALVNGPDLVFLDELTTGLDPQARLAIWNVIREIRDSSTTVVLTTHYMEEAETLCDRVAIVDHGNIIALDTVPALLRSASTSHTLSFTPDHPIPLHRLATLPGVVHVEMEGERVVVRGRDTRFPAAVLATLADDNVWPRDLRTEQPNLEHLFLELTGRAMRQGEPR
ncbi:MAG: ABC transporter ATP-binding protein [Deinococcales bacterium]|jgi:ABC-2 type transport system ATP-binding protein